MVGTFSSPPRTSNHDRTSGSEFAPSSVALRVDGLTRDYGGTGLFEVSLSVPSGSVLGLVGPNGAGKTTLLSIVAGTRRADSGTVFTSIPRRKIAVCPDVPEFDGWLTAFEVVDLARSFVAPEADGQAVSEALRVTGLAEVAGHRVGGFSRGMTQRLGLATTLVGRPRLIILDEPISALDPAGRVDMLSLIAGLRQTTTVILSSHILSDVQRVADRVGILRAGRLVYEGRTQALIDEYLQPRWRLRLAGDPHQVAAALTEKSWVTRIATHSDQLIVEAKTIRDGQLGIPAVIAAVGAELVSCEPIDADLESAFLALTGGEAP